MRQLALISAVTLSFNVLGTTGAKTQPYGSGGGQGGPYGGYVQTYQQGSTGQRSSDRRGADHGNPTLTSRTGLQHRRVGEPSRQPHQ